MSSRKSVAGFGVSFALVLTVAALFGPQARAQSVLLAAPSAGGSYYGAYCNSCVGASFTLTASSYVSTISVVLSTPSGTSFTTFDFSLMSSATTTIVSQALTAPVGAVTPEVINVNQTLPAGTYYLVGNVPGYFGTPVTAGDVDGWMLSTGVYDDAAGAVTNGVGMFQAGQWVVNNAPGYTAPAFSVNGTLLTTTTLAVAPTTAAFGSLFTLTATVQDQNGNPVTNGTVTFYNGTAALGTVQVVGTTSGGGTIGTASLNTILVPLGANSITATYAGGDPTSTSSAMVATVTGTYPTTTALTYSGTAGDYTLTGTVAGAGPISPTGNVTFTDSTTGSQVGGAELNSATWAQTFVNAPLLSGYSNPVVAVLADVNGDGIPDLLIANYSGNGGVTVQLGNGDGTFKAPTQIASGNVQYDGLAVGDFNADGRLDVATIIGGNILVFLGNGDGTFSQSGSYDSGSPGGLSVGDFNGDGILDLVAVNTNRVDLLLGNGDGTFAAPQTYSVSSPLGLAVGDLNGDGLTDLVVATAPNDVSVFFGTASGTLQSGQTYVTEYEPGNMILADLRGIGKLDLVTVFAQCCEGTNTAVYVMLGNGDGTFDSPYSILSGTNYSGVATGDFNGDGKLDLVVSDYGYPADNILLGNGDGTFQSPISFSAGVGPITPAVADLNHDGRPDFVAPNYNDGTANVFLNQVTQTATLSNAAVYGTGQQSVAGAYGGDTNFAASTSPAVSLTGTGIPIVSLSAPSLAFGNQLLGTTSTSQTETVTNSGTGNLAVTTLAIVGADAGDFTKTADTCTGSAVVPNGTCKVSLTFAPSAVGSRSASLTFTDNAANSPQAVPLSGTGMGSVVSLSPLTVSFSPQLSGSSSSAETVTVTNTGNANLTFTSISASGAFAVSKSATTCSSSNTVAASEACTVALVFSPTTAGVDSSTLSFIDNAPNTPQTVTLTGTGQDFSLAAAAGSPTSQTVSPGSGASYSVTATSLDGFNQAVSFTCSLPASEAACQVSSKSLTPSASGTTLTISVTTTTPSLSAPRKHPLPPIIPILPSLIWLATVALTLGTMPSIIERRNRLAERPWRARIVSLGAGLLLTLVLVACGGGTGGSVTPNAGTPVGNYTVTVTGTAVSGSSTLSHSVPLMLDVN